MSLDHPDERDGDREEEEEEEEEERQERQQQQQYTHKQRLAQSAANDDEKNENKDAYYHIIVLKDEGSIHDFNGLVHRLLRRGLLSLRGWDYHVEQIHFIGHAVPFSNRPLVLRSRVWMGDDGVAV